MGLFYSVNSSSSEDKYQAASVVRLGDSAVLLTQSGWYVPLQSKDCAPTYSVSMVDYTYRQHDMPSVNQSGKDQYRLLCNSALLFED